MKIALCQMELRLYDPDANLSKMLDMLEISADLYIFPETCLTGFDGTSKVFSLDLSTYHAELAKTGKNVLFGSVVDRKNAAILVSKRRIAGYYFKTHLFSHGGESEFFQAGDSCVIWEISGIKVLPQICYDLRFPAEIYFHAAGADVLVFIANWPVERVEHWNTLLKARAIENQRFVVGVNCVGSHKWRYNGHSAVYDPWGKRTVFLGEEECVKVVEIDIPLISEISNAFNTRKDFRPELIGGVSG